jgi:hypothetical protein
MPNLSSRVDLLLFNPLLLEELHGPLLLVLVCQENSINDAAVGQLLLESCKAVRFWLSVVVRVLVPLARHAGVRPALLNLARSYNCQSLLFCFIQGAHDLRQLLAASFQRDLDLSHTTP